MSKGDVVFVRRMLTMREKAIIERMYSSSFGMTLYRHYGIDIGDGTVIHFHGDIVDLGSSACIKCTSMRTFLDGGDGAEIDTTVIAYYDAEEVVRRAKSKLGSNFDGYDLLSNNCEHFANWCATGDRYSRQVWFKKDDRSFGSKLVDNIAEPINRFLDKGDKFLGTGRYEGKGTINKFDKYVDKFDKFLDKIFG